MTRWKQNISLLVMVFLFFSCEKSENTMTGDLYFVLLDASNYNVIDIDRRRVFKETAEHLAELDSLNPKQIELLKNYEFLMRNKLLNKPKIFVRTPSGTVEEVYITLNDFKEISKYSFLELRENNQRIHIEMEMEFTKDSLLVAYQINHIQKLDGKTFYKQN
ncbi:MAG: hypothetical protein GW771_09380 [Flavobacteriia bacterium]|nr:hypothetical protein [Flavobacteriia bacterium]